MLCKWICHDVKLGQVGQGGGTVQVILVALHMLEVNGDTSERVPDLTNGPDEVGMGRATWGEFLIC